MFKISAATILGFGIATCASAQDLPTTQLQDHGQVVRQDMLTRSLLRQNRTRAPRATKGQMSACTQKAKFRAQYGAGHPQVRELYRLCRGIGM